MRLKTRVIVNPESNRGRTRKRWGKIREGLRHFIREFKFEFTEKPLHATDLARQAKLSTAQVSQIEKIHAHAAPEVIAAVKSGEINLSTAATLVSLSEDEQRQAAAGGKAELKQAAKRVREARRKPRPAREDGDEAPLAGADADHVASPGELQSEVAVLRRQVITLTAENQALRMELEALRARLPLAEPADSDY